MRFLQLSFDSSTSERLSLFLQSVLDALATILEVSELYDVGKHSEEVLTYLRLIIVVEPVACLHCVQQVPYTIFSRLYYCYYFAITMIIIVIVTIIIIIMVIIFILNLLQTRWMLKYLLSMIVYVDVAILVMFT